MTKTLLPKLKTQVDRQNKVYVSRLGVVVHMERKSIKFALSHSLNTQTQTHIHIRGHTPTHIRTYSHLHTLTSANSPVVWYIQPNM